MRKRSETPTVVAPQSPMKQQEIPGTQAPPLAQKADFGSNISVDNSIVFIKCPDCGLVQSTETAVRIAVRSIRQPPGGGQTLNLLHCIRCKGLLDPDELLSDEYIARLKREGLGVASNAVPSNPTAPKQPDPPPAASASPLPQKVVSEAPKPSNWGPPRFCHHPKGDSVCGRELTQTNAGYFAPCGHSQEGPVLKQDVLKAAGQSVSGEIVSVTWAEEVFNMGNYSSFRVGPFSRSSSVRPGETVEQALERLNSDLSTFARAEFSRKAHEFLRSLDQLTGMISEQDNKRKAARA